MSTLWIRNGEGKVYGPYSRSDLSGMVATGILSHEMHISTDKEKWIRAGDVKGLFREREPLRLGVNASIEANSMAQEIERQSSSSAGTDPQASVLPLWAWNENFTSALIDRGLGWYRTRHVVGFLNSWELLLAKMGLYGLYVAGLLGLMHSVSLPLRFDALREKLNLFIVGGVVWLLGCVAVHYMAVKFLANIKRMLAATPTRISSSAFSNCLAVALSMSAICSIFVGTIAAINRQSFGVFLTSAGIFFFCQYGAAICMNPSMINIRIDENSGSAEELIGLFSLFMKGFLKAIPIIFGSGVVYGVYLLFEMLFLKFEYTFQVYTSLLEAAQFVAAALLPVVGYFTFLFYFFLADLCLAVLSIRRAPE